MPHSYTNLLYHIVFATRGRQPWLADPIRPRLFGYLGKLVTDQGGVPLSVNGIEDHIHILARLRPDRSLSQVLSDIKARSSGWIHRTWPDLKPFAWQRGYGAFTLSPSAVPAVTQYIQNQEEHHRRVPYDQELRTMLRRAGLNADDPFYWE